MQFLSCSRGVTIPFLQQGRDNSGVENQPYIELRDVFPAPPQIDAPAGVPGKAAKFFVEASEDLRRGRDAAGVIGKCRSVLDICLKELDAKGEGRKKRIADLRARGVLTTSLADWAEKLWDDGNVAIHDLDGDAEEARQHVRFLELFFEVAFALPAQIEQAQGAQCEPGEEVDGPA